MALVLETDTPEGFESAVHQAIDLLRKGEVVALPTETVYGLAANAWDERAVARIFEIKGRPASNPLIVHIASLGMARECAQTWPEAADRLAHRFWPGPLTLVLPKSEKIPALVSAKGPTVGIRWPSHPLMQAVIRRAGFPLAAPSANVSNYISPTSAAHVQAGLGTRIPLIVNGGACQFGIESTVLDLTGQPTRILRPGMIHQAELETIVGEVAGATQETEILKSPGQLLIHYSPRARVALWSWENEAQLNERLRSSGIPFEKVHILAHTQVPQSGVHGRVSVIPLDAEAYARALYAEFHWADQQGMKWIIVEEIPSEPAWMGIRDRLTRAQGSR